MPGKIPYVYDKRLNGGRGGYRDTTTGRAVSASTFGGWRDTYITAQQAQSKALTDQVTSGKITLTQWEKGMRQIIKDTHGTLYAAAKGGFANMTQSDWGRVGQEVRKQYEYLAKFRAELAAGKSTPGQAATRAAMYPGSGNQAWEKGRAANVFDPRLLPAYPGDGSTQCRTNCKCRWEIIESETAYLCYWRLGSEKSCADCPQRAVVWNPYTINKIPGITLGAVKQHLERMA